MTKRRVNAGKPGGSNTNLNDLLKNMDENPLLEGSGSRLPVNVHPKLIRKLDELKMKTYIDAGTNQKKVSSRALITEALTDLFEKYEAAAAAGKDDESTACKFHDGEDFKAL